MTTENKTQEPAPQAQEPPKAVTPPPTIAETSALATLGKEIGSVFLDKDAFENAQRMSKMLACSDLVPQTFKGNIPNCVIAVDLAQRLNASPLLVMQNLYIVYGKPSWASQFLIACVNACGKFSALRYKMEGVGENASCIAWAYDRATGEKLDSPTVSIKMAKAEGWYDKNGSKWKTMPELMLRYRAATFFTRLYAPELTMGIPCQDEVIDITPSVEVSAPVASTAPESVTPEVTPPPRSPKEKLGDALRRADSSGGTPADASPELPMGQ